MAESESMRISISRPI